MKRHALVVLAFSVLSALAARLVTRVALVDMALVMDVITYVFQAKVLASGRLTAPALEPLPAFNQWFLEDRGARYGIFPPGWPAVLALGLKLGLVHWVNPALHGATVFLVGRAGERAGGERLSMIAAGLYAASPQAVLLAASLMSHTLVAFAGGVVLLFATTLFEQRRAPFGFAGGGGGGGGGRAPPRPVCAMVLAGAAALAVLLYGRSPEARPLATGVGATLGALPPVAALFAYNRALTGSASRFPQMAYFDGHLAPSDQPFFRYAPGCNALGFGRGHGCDLTVASGVHTPLNALSNSGDNLTAWLLLACGPVLAVGLALALARKETRARAMYLVAVPLLTVALYTLYWHGGTCYGARFYHAALPAALLLVALGISLRDRRVTAGLLAAALAWNAFAFRRASKEIADPVWGYWAVDARFRELKQGWDKGRALVMVAFGPDDLYNPKLGWTAIVPDGAMWMLNIRALAALAENPLVVDDAEVVFAKFHPALVDELRARFPDRALYLYVANGKRDEDTVEPFDPTRFPAERYREPAPNFDGFRVAPPLLPPPASLRPPDEANLYPPGPAAPPR